MKKEILIYFKSLGVIIFMSLFLEIFIFNFSFFKTLNYQEKLLDNIDIGQNIKKNSNIYEISSNENNYIEFKNINKHINNIKFDIEILSSNRYLEYSIFANDDANELYFELPKRYYYPSIEKSKYVTMNLSGISKSIKLNFNNNSGNNIVFKINNVSINNRIPFDFSFTRFFIVFILMMMLYLIRPNSSLYKYKINFKSNKQKLLFIVLFVVECIFMFYVVNTNKLVKYAIGYSNHNQYQDLAISLSKGKSYLEIKPSEEIKNMKNPYDTNYRMKLMNENGAVFEWDRSYYRGKYYVYFGIVPVIVSYLPYYLITNKNLPNYIIVYLVSIMTMIGMFLFLKELVKRYFPNTKLPIFIIILGWLVNCSGLLSILGYATLYNVPIVFSLMFLYFGLYFWLYSIKEKKISSIYILLGSLCMALIAGCRPHLLIGSIFAIPFFWNSIFKKRLLFSRKSIKQTIFAILPYIVIAVLLMYYNKIRFDSVFDFGSNYNITSNDMTRRGFNLDRIGLGIFSYLLQPPNITAVFPFLHPSLFMTNYMGTTISERLFGGLLITNILLIIGIIAPRFKKIIPKNLYKISLISVLGAFIVIILDIQIAGILPRYISDFAWLLFLPAIIVILSIFNSKISMKYKRIFLELAIFLIGLSFLYQFIYMFEDQFMNDMINNNTQFYFKWYYLLQWWL